MIVITEQHVTKEARYGLGFENPPLKRDEDVLNSVMLDGEPGFKELANALCVYLI